MALMDFIKKQFIDIIQWTEEGDGTLAWRFPMQDMEIQNGASLTVRESQLAVFVNEGQVADVFGPGMHKLSTQTLPVLTYLKNWDKLFESPFKSDVYFFSTRQQVDQKWGTPQPITVRDPDFGAVRLRAFGNYAFRVTDPKRFHTEISGTRERYTVADIDGQLRGLIEQLRYDFDQSQRRQQEATTSFDARIKGLEAEALAHPATGGIPAADGDVGLGASVGTAPNAAPALSSAADEEALYLKSFDLLKGGKYDDAIAGFKSMLGKYPQGNYSDNAWYWTGESYYIKKDFPNALSSYRSLLEKFGSSPKVPDALLKTGIIQQEQKKNDAAKAAYNRVIKEFPNSSAAIQARTRVAQLR